MFCFGVVPNRRNTVVTHPNDTYAAAPYSAVFECRIEGYSHLNITWLKNYGRMALPDKCTILNTKYSSTTTKSILVIPNAAKSDGGVYSCVVTTGWPAISFSATLNYISGIYYIIVLHYCYLYFVVNTH